MNLKRIAICMSGTPRNWKLSLQSVKKHLFDLYETDIFIVTWKTNDLEAPLDVKDLEQVTKQYCTPIIM